MNEFAIFSSVCTFRGVAIQNNFGSILSFFIFVVFIYCLFVFVCLFHFVWFLFICLFVIVVVVVVVLVVGGSGVGEKNKLCEFNNAKQNTTRARCRWGAIANPHA